jgi:hypothetical protein
LAGALADLGEHVRRPSYFAEALRAALGHREVVQGCRMARMEPERLAAAATRDMDELCLPVATEEQKLEALTRRALALVPASRFSRVVYELTRLSRLVAWLTIRYWPVALLLGLAGLYLSRFLEVTDWLHSLGSVAVSNQLSLSLLLPLAMALNLVWAGIVRVADIHSAPLRPGLRSRLLSPPEEIRIRAEIVAALDLLKVRLVTNSLLPYLRTQINLRLRNTYETVLQMDQRPIPGLHQVADAELEIPTNALRIVDRAMRRMRSGSIGISGPRGAGKTTLLRAICEGRLDTGEPIAMKRVSIMVAAPVDYQARDFLLHLYSELCQAVRSSLDPNYTSPRPLLTQRPPGPRLAEAVWDIGLVIGRSGLVFGSVLGAQLLVADALNQPPVAGWLARVPGSGALLTAVPAGTALITAGVALLWLLRELRSVHAVSRTLVSLAVVIGLGVSALAALAHVGPAALGSLDRRFAGLALLAGSGAVAVVWAAFQRLTQWRDTWPGRNDVEAVPLEDLAERRLQRIRYQQTYSSGWSTGMRITAPGGALDLDSSLSRGLSLAEVEQTLPQLVAEFREFAARVTQAGLTVVVGIDELDKIERDSDARRFVNDLKTVFGIPGAFFLISISEDAMADFERRGMPFRDAFDSALDEVVRVGYLTFDEAREVLRRRVIGIPIPFIGLAYALSGGLARELVRVTRHIVDLELGQLTRTAHGLVQADLAGKVSSLMLMLAAREGTEEVVRWCANLRTDPVGAVHLLQHCADVAELTVGAGETAADRPLRLARELAAYEYLCATVLEYFVDDRAETDWQRIEGGCAGTDEAGQGRRPLGEGGCLDDLAAARQAFSVSPWLAWNRVSVFRRQWGMDVLPALP